MSAPRPPAAPPEAEGASLCPLCGAPNACALAAPGPPAGPCWCASARIAPETLARVPEEARGRRCICARCAGG